MQLLMQHAWTLCAWRSRVLAVVLCGRADLSCVEAWVPAAVLTVPGAAAVGVGGCVVDAGGAAVAAAAVRASAVSCRGSMLWPKHPPLSLLRHAWP